MAQVSTVGFEGVQLGIHIESAFDNLEEAKQRAGEVFTCVLAAVGRNSDGSFYLRPVESRDPNIYAYAVVTTKQIGEE